MKQRILLICISLFGTFAMRGQMTDVTSLFLANADFSHGPVVTGDIRGYGKDMVAGDVYGLRPVTDWAITVTAADNSNATYPNSAMGAGILSYGSSNQLKGYDLTAPATGPTGSTSNNCLGFFGVWGNGGYYYQTVTLPAGTYKISVPVYRKAGNRAFGQSYVGWWKDGDATPTAVAATMPAANSWTTMETTFTLTNTTKGKICIGYKSGGGGSAENPHLFFDRIQLLSYALSPGTQATLDAGIWYSFFAGDKGTYSIVAKRSGNNNTTLFYTTAEDLSSPSNLNLNDRERTATINVTSPTFIHVRADLGANVTISLTTNNEANAIGDLSSYWVENRSDFDTKVNSGNYLFLLADATAGSTYTMSDAAPFTTEKPQYQAYANPFAVSSQMWTVKKADDNCYTFQSYNDNYYINTETTGYGTSMDKAAATANFQVDVLDRNFHFWGTSVIHGANTPGKFVGPWNDGGAVNLANAPTEDIGHEQIASNKILANAPGFHIYAIPRANYEAGRINSEAMMHNGWTKVVSPDQLGLTGYEYVLLDVSEQGVESGYALRGSNTGLDDNSKPKYAVLDSSSNPDALIKWRMRAHKSGFYLKNVQNENYMYCSGNSHTTGFTTDANADNTDFVFTTTSGLWTISNSSDLTHFVGRWANSPLNPYADENVAFNKSDGAGKRQFIILTRPTGNIGVVNGGEEGWTEIQELPADLNNHFFSYYNNETTGLGLALSDGTQHQGNKTMEYVADLDPNANKNALWTLISDPNNGIMNTAALFPEFMMQTEWDGKAPDGAHNYRVNNNGNTQLNSYADYAWGYILPTFDTSNFAWYIGNGKYADNYLGNWSTVDRETHDPTAGQEVAFNKTVAGRDYYEIFAIPRGRYVANDVEDKEGEQDISYMITNAEATRRTTIGWTQVPDNSFQVQNNAEFAQKSGNYYFQSWESQVLSDRQIYQEYTDVPDGYYTIKVLTNVDKDGAYLFLNGEQVPLMQKDDNGVATLTAHINSGKLRFGVKLKNYESNWVAFDKVELYYCANKDVSDEYLWNPSFELSNETEGHLMGWTIPTGQKSQLDNESEARNNNNLSDKDGDWYFNTWDTTTGDKTLGIQTTTKKILPAGVYQLSALLAGYNDADVVMNVYGSPSAGGTTATANLLNSVVYRASGIDDGNYGADTGSKQLLYFTLDNDMYITIYVYNTATGTGTAFFKCDDFRLVTYSGKPNIASGILPNPSFEYADGSGSPAIPGVVYSTQKGINNLSDGQEGNGGIYGWVTTGMELTGGQGENRVGIGADFSLDYYYYVPEDKLDPIIAADGTRYFYSGQYRRNSGGNQSYTMSTTTLGNLSVGTYIATIKYKAAMTYAGPTANGSSIYAGSWPMHEGEEANITFTARNGATTLATITSGELPIYNREYGDGTFETLEKGWVGGRPAYRQQLQGGWTKIWLVFRIEEPTQVTFEIGEQLRTGYSVDFFIDDLRLQAMNEVEKPMYCTEGSITNGEEYYLMNAATGYFLGAGANWGTHAALIEHGQPFKAEGSGTTFALNSYTYNGADLHYLTGPYLDGASTNFTITHTGDGKYTIADGEGKYVKPVSSVGTSTVIAENQNNTNDILAKWYFITKAQREQIMLEDPEEPDATFYIPNASFGRNQNTQWNVNQWKENHFQGNFTLGDPHVAEAYHSPFIVKKTVTVPNGTYKFRAQGFYREDVVEGKTRNDYLPEFFANDESVHFPKQIGHESNRETAELAFLDGDYYTDYVTVKVTNNLLTVGCRLDVNESLWCIWDNFELELVTKDNPATTADLTDINAAFSTMEAAKGFEGQQWAPYVITEQKNNLVANGTTGSYTFEAIDTKFPYSFDKIDEYLLGLTNTEYVNAFYRGDFSEYHNWDVTSNANYRTPALGWTVDAGDAPAVYGVQGLKYTEPAYDNDENAGLAGVDSRKALYIASGKTVTYGSTTGYEMPLKGGKNYELTFLYGGWGGAPSITLGGLSISAIATGKEPVNTKDVANWKEYKATFTGEAGNNTFTISSTGADGVVANLKLFPSSLTPDPDLYYLYNKGAEKYLAAGYTGNATSNGTSAILTEFGGLDLGLVESGSGFSFDTKIYATTAAHFLSNALDENNNLQLDVEEATWYASDAGTYGGYDYIYIYNASDKYLTRDGDKVTLAAYSAGNDNQKWALKTYAQRVAEMRALPTDGTATIDATFLIQGANFGYRDSRNNAWSLKLDGNEGVRLSEGNFEIKDGYRYPAENPTNDTHTRGGATTQARYGGNNINYLCETWHHSTDLYQTLTTRDGVTLPMGVYTLSAECFDGDWDNENNKAKGTTSYVYIADMDFADATHTDRVDAGYYRFHPLAIDTVAFMRTPSNLNPPAYYFVCDEEIDGTEPPLEKTLAKYFLDNGNDLRQTTPESFVFGNAVDSEHPVTMRVGARNVNADQWMVFDNFRLTYRPFSADDKDQVNEYKNSKALLTNIDSEAPYNDAPFCVPITDERYVAVTNQENVVSALTSSNSQEEMRNEFVKLRYLNVDYIEDAEIELWTNPNNFSGRLFSLKNELDGTKVLTVKSLKENANEPNSISLNFSDAPGAIYPQALNFVKQTVGTQKNTFTFTYKDGLGETRYIGTGETVNPGAWNKERQIRSLSDEGNAQIFRIVPQTTDDGRWYLKHMGLKENMDLDDTGLYMGTGNKRNINFSFPEAQMAPSIPTSVTSQYHFSTLISPYDVEPTELATAEGGGTILPYKIKSVGDGKTILTSDTKIHANVPYILYNSSETDNAAIELQNFGQAFTDIDFEENSLVGTFRNNEVDIPVGSFILSVKNYPGKGNVMAWYRVVDSGRKATAYKCFFRPNSSVGGDVSAFIFAFDDEEEVDAITPSLFNPDNTILDIFDMTGKKLPRLQKGVNLLKMSDGSIQKVLVQ